MLKGMLAAPNPATKCICKSQLLYMYPEATAQQPGLNLICYIQFMH